MNRVIKVDPHIYINKVERNNAELQQLIEKAGYPIFASIEQLSADGNFADRFKNGFIPISYQPMISIPDEYIKEFCTHSAYTTNDDGTRHWEEEVAYSFEQANRDVGLWSTKASWGEVSSLIDFLKDNYPEFDIASHCTMRKAILMDVKQGCERTIEYIERGEATFPYEQAQNQSKLTEKAVEGKTELDIEEYTKKHSENDITYMYDEAQKYADLYTRLNPEAKVDVVLVQKGIEKPEVIVTIDNDDVQRTFTLKDNGLDNDDLYRKEGNEFKVLDESGLDITFQFRTQIAYMEGVNEGMKRVLEKQMPEPEKEEPEEEWIK